MAFPYYPAYQPQMYQNQYIPQQQTQQNGFLAAWIQGGEQSMKSYTLTGANQRVYLFSTDENIFGVKSTEATGKPHAERIKRHTTTFQHTSHSGNLIQCRSVSRRGDTPIFKEDDDMTKDERAEIISQILDLLDRLGLVTSEEAEHNP